MCMDLVVRGASLHFVENNQTLAFAQQSFRCCGQCLPHGGHPQVKDPKRRDAKGSHYTFFCCMVANSPSGRIISMASSRT